MEERQRERNSHLRTIVLGANGFLGSHFVDAAISAGSEVTAIDRFTRAVAFQRAPFHSVVQDLSKDLELEEFCFEAGAVFDAGGSFSPRTIQSYSEIPLLVEAFRRNVEYLARKGIKTYGFCSSGGVIYGNANSPPFSESDPVSPNTPYGHLKVECEKVLLALSEKYGFQPKVFRFGNVYGPRQSLKNSQGSVARLVQCLRDKTDFPIWVDSKSTRDFIYVEDAVSIALQLLSASSEHAIFNIGTGIGTSLESLIRLFSEVAGTTIGVSYQVTEAREPDISFLDMSLTRSVLPRIHMRELRVGLTDYLAELEAD